MATRAPLLCMIPRTEISPTVIPAGPSLCDASRGMAPVPMSVRNGSRRPSARYTYVSVDGGVAAGAAGTAAGGVVAAGIWPDVAVGGGTALPGTAGAAGGATGGGTTGGAAVLAGVGAGATGTGFAGACAWGVGAGLTAFSAVGVCPRTICADISNPKAR